MGLCLWEVPAVESLSQKSKIFASSLSQGSLRRAAGVNAHGSLLRIVASLTHPVSLLRCSRCTDQSPPCQRGVVWRSQTGGIPRAGRFPHGFVLVESACCGIPQSKIKDFCQLPFTREPCGQCPRTISHGNLQQIVTAPPAPGNVTWLKKTHRPKPPLPKGGASATPRRGDSTEWKFSTWVCSFKKCQL